MSDKAAVLGRLTLILRRINGPVENERTAAVASFQSIVENEQIDLREISLTNGQKGPEDIDAMVHARVEEWRDAYRIADPSGHKIHLLIEKLQTDNKALRAENIKLRRHKLVSDEHVAAAREILKEARAEKKAAAADKKSVQQMLQKVVKTFGAAKMSEDENDE